MFTGIIQGQGQVVRLHNHRSRIQVGIQFPKALLNPLINIGASVSVNGVCLTLVSCAEDICIFDIGEETLQKTTLKDLTPGQTLHLERALKLGDELGGHLLSGHVMGTAHVTRVEKPSDDQLKLFFSCPSAWHKFLIPKGFIAVDGASLTLVNTPTKHCPEFSVHLIPETLRQTQFSKLKTGDLVNIEIDHQTQVLVETVEHYLQNQAVEKISNIAS